MSGIRSDTTRNFTQLRDQLRSYWVDDIRRYSGTGNVATSNDHGLLAGLGDDDHPHYLTQSRGDARYPLLGHTHDDRYYTETELNNGQLDTRYYTETELSNGQLDSRYYTETESDNRFVRLATAGTITAQHSFSPGSAQAPFLLGANAQGQTVVGLRADQLNRTLFAGNGLIGAGALTTDITIDVGAGTLIAVGANDVSLANGTAQYQVPVTGASPFTPAYTALSTFAGTGLNFSSGTFVLGNPTTLGIATANSVFGQTHTHAITSSSNPGAAANLLASDANGYLTLVRVTATDRLTSPLLTNSSALSVTTSSGNITFDAAGDNLIVNPSNVLKSSNYASQTTGWGISYEGGGDFRYLYADEMHVKSFIADLEQALAGGQIITKSVAVLAVDFTAPAAGGTATLRVRDLPSAANMAVFQSGDIVRLRQFSRSAGSLSVSDCWGVVTAYADQTDGTQTWTFTRSAAPNAGAMTAGVVVAADSIVLDYGTTGNGFYEVNAIDGVYGANSPYAQIVTWSGHPATGLSVRGRYGNLKGIFGVSNEFGIAVGTGFTTSDKYLRLSSAVAESNNLDMSWKAGGVDLITVKPTTGISLQTYDAGGGVIGWGDQRILSWAETIGAATPDGAIWTQRTATQNEFYIEANQVGSRAGWIRMRARGESATGSAKTDAFFTLAGAQATTTRSVANLTVDDFTVDLGNGSADIGKMTVYAAQILMSDGGGSIGTAAAPILSFVGDTSTGIYQNSAGQMNFSVSGTNRLSITSSSLSAFAGTDTTHTFGYAAIGYDGLAGRAAFAHQNFMTSGSRALEQTSDGTVIMNCASGTSLQFKIGNTNYLYLTSSGFRVGGSAAPTHPLDVTGNAYINQNSTTLADAVLKINQADLSEEFIDFQSTVGAGNPIDTAALGSYYGKVRVSVNGTFKWLALYN